jgi:stage II sporulation protein D
MERIDKSSEKIIPLVNRLFLRVVGAHVKNQPKIAVGIMDRRAEVAGYLNGSFRLDGLGTISDRFSAKTEEGMVVLTNEARREISRSPWIRLKAGIGSTFKLLHVTIGKRFHWERTEDQTFGGDLILRLREDGTLVSINEIPLEDYLTSVISSEMNAAAPREFLKAHAILSRSWLLAALDRKDKSRKTSIQADTMTKETGSVLRWYEREDHDLFDVCSDDHCQRYQGVTKIASKQAEEAVRETRGRVITCQGEICDARYSKACGGVTEEFSTAWDDMQVPYLESISDSPVPHQSIRSEDEASRWVLSEPEAYCNTKDETLLDKILSGPDRATKDFFRWKVEYSRPEIEEILRKKSGFDFGSLRNIVPLQRGPSGRIFRLKIIGSKKTMVVGKELEIRNWLSRSHLYSSAFVISVKRNPHGEAERFIFDGAGWGHGVGLCQIGAAVMAARGFSAEDILKHYFQDTETKIVY